MSSEGIIPDPVPFPAPDEAPPPRRAPRLECEPFRPDGVAPAGGLILLLGGTALAATGLGFVLSFVGQWFYFPFVFPAVTGLLLGGVVYGLVRTGKIRSPALAITAGALGGVGMMLSNHYFDYLREYNDPAWGGNPPANVFEFIDAEAQAGVVLGDVGNANNGGVNLGRVGSYIYFAVEAFIAALCGFIIARSAAATPYCRECGVWKQVRTLADLPHVPPRVAVEAVQAGALLDLVESGAPPRTGCPLKLKAHVCPRCAGQGTVVAEVQLITTDARGRRYTKALAQSVYPGEVLALVDEYSPWHVAPPAAPRPAPGEADKTPPGTAREDIRPAE